MAKAPFEPHKPSRTPEERRARRSLARNRGTLVRALGYAFPYKWALVLAFGMTFGASFFGAFSLVPMVPVIEVVTEPEEAVGRLHERREAIREEIAGAVDEKPSVRARLENMVPGMRDTRLSYELKALDLRIAVTEKLVAEPDRSIRWIVIVMMAAALIKALLDYQSKYQFSHAYMSATQDMKVDLYTACLDLDMAAISERTSGNLISRLSSDINKFRTIISTSLTNTIKVPFEIVFLLMVLFILSAKVTMIAAIAIPVLVFPMVVLSKKLRDLAKRDAEEDAYLVDVMQETIQGLQIVKAFNTEKAEQKRFRKVARDQLRRQMRRARLALAAPVIVEVVTMASIASVIYVGYFLVLKTNVMSIAEFIVYLFALTRFYKPIKETSGGYVKVQKALASAERVFEIIDSRPKVVEKADAVELPPIEEAIEFKGVSFRYDSSPIQVLRSCSFTVPKGKTVALVGLSGSGKTTVSRLVPRFFDPTEGTVAIDGVDLRDVTLSSLRNQIAIVTQETILFDTTIFENIAYGKRGATVEEVENAARMANAHDFIMSLSSGYQTRVGERAGRLSGGQRQRIAIARALLRDCPILLLDEATSALDNESESLIQEEFDRLMKGRTVLVIAHRLSTIRNADCILVMDLGTVIEQGTHVELLARGGRYAEFWNKGFDLKNDSSVA